MLLKGGFSGFKRLRDEVNGNSNPELVARETLSIAQVCVVSQHKIL